MHRCWNWDSSSTEGILFGLLAATQKAGPLPWAYLGFSSSLVLAFRFLAWGFPLVPLTQCAQLLSLIAITSWGWSCSCPIPWQQGNGEGNRIFKCCRDRTPGMQAHRLHGRPSQISMDGVSPLLLVLSAAQGLPGASVDTSLFWRATSTPPFPIIKPESLCQALHVEIRITGCKFWEPGESYPPPQTRARYLPPCWALWILSIHSVYLVLYTSIYIYVCVCVYIYIYYLCFSFLDKSFIYLL